MGGEASDSDVVCVGVVGVEAVASSLTERIANSVVDEGGGAPLSALQVHFIRNMIHEALEDFR